MYDIFETMLESPSFPAPFFIQEDRNEKISRFASDSIICNRKQGKPALLVSPPLSIHSLKRMNVVESLGKTFAWGGGKYSIEGWEFFALGRDDTTFDPAPNTFLSLALVLQERFIETADFMIDKLGGIVIVNRFGGELPENCRLTESGVAEICGRDTWEMFPSQEFLRIRLPVSELKKIRSNSLLVPGERMKIDMKVSRRGGFTIVPSRKEDRHTEMLKDSLSDKIKQYAKMKGSLVV